MGAQQTLTWLDIPIEALLLPELESLGKWARMVHEQLINNDLSRLKKLAERGTLRRFLLAEEMRLAELACDLEESWKRENPAPLTFGYFDLAAWHNHAKSYATEMVLEQISEMFEASKQVF
ncbi:hypothetical protein GCM10017655_30580 [Pseudomonas turukhanskensis]|uniref:Uncharacterized protein n=2 Tax=Pseudomonas turukhanskensis TaxID=1806536 RepID=A0A9W6NGR7_9PSED|nr:hypothetical protein GCM10017655_30580 [Pseudomonas turukhanskensis]